MQYARTAENVIMNDSRRLYVIIGFAEQGERGGEKESEEERDRTGDKILMKTYMTTGALRLYFIERVARK